MNVFLKFSHDFVDRFRILRGEFLLGAGTSNEK